MQTARKNPTPTPTVIKSTVLLICGTVSASTCKSGSAIVTAKPNAKLTSTISGSFFVFVSAVPILFPILIIEVSAPSEKRPIPITTITVPIKKFSIRSVLIGAMLKHNNVTIITIGRTERADSLIFSVTAVRFLSIKSFFKSLTFPYKKCNYLHI